tara:strand:- start:4637 stop:5551 length:915 start_codon:yes stop_codon:yes gene_type:complete
MSRIYDIVELLTWSFYATYALLWATVRASFVVVSITFIVHWLGPDTLGTEDNRSALAVPVSTLLAFLTSGLISSSNTNNGDVRATVSKLVGSGKMLMTLVGMLRTGCDLQEATGNYVDAIASAAQSDKPGRGDVHENAVKFLKEAIVKAHESLASSKAEVFKGIVDQLNQTHGVYGRLVSVRSTRQQPPIVLGYWVTTAISSALTASASVDQSLATMLLSTCLSGVPAAALYLASVPDPLHPWQVWQGRASSIRLELESLKKYKDSILLIGCPGASDLTFTKLTRQKTDLLKRPEQVSLLPLKR